MNSKLLFGYKTSVGTYRDSRSLIYSLRHETDYSGTKVVIDVYEDNGRTFNKVSTIEPVIPYRVMLADYNLLHNDPSFLINQPIDSSNNLIFNSGCAVVDGKIYSTICSSNSQPYFEFSFTRSGLQNLLNKQIIIEKKSNGSENKKQFTSIKAYDLNPRLGIRKSDTLDILVLSCVTRINIRNDNGIDYDYCIPVCLVFKIDISSIPSGILKPNVFFPGVSNYRLINNNSGNYYINYNIIPKYTNGYWYSVDKYNSCDCDIYVDENIALFTSYYLFKFTTIMAIATQKTRKIQTNLFNINLTYSDQYSVGTKNDVISVSYKDENDSYIPTKISVVNYNNITYLASTILSKNKYLSYIYSISNNNISSSIQNDTLNIELNRVDNNIYASYFSHIDGFYVGNFVDIIAKKNYCRFYLKEETTQYKYNNIQIKNVAIDKSRMDISTLEKYLLPVINNAIYEQSAYMYVKDYMMFHSQNYGYISSRKYLITENTFPIKLVDLPDDYVCTANIRNNQLYFVYDNIPLSINSDMSIKWSLSGLYNIDNKDISYINFYIPNNSGIFKGDINKDKTVYFDYSKTNINLTQFIYGANDLSYWAKFSSLQKSNRPTARFYLTYNDGIERSILASGIETNVIASNYDTNGIFDLDIFTSIDTSNLYDGNGYSFNDIGFSLDNVNWKLEIYDCFENLLTSNSGVISLSLPTFSGSILSSVTKTVSDELLYNWNRTEYAQLKNVIVTVDGDNSTKFSLSPILNVNDGYSGVYNIPIISYSKGSTVEISSNIYLHGTNMFYKYISNKVTYCKNHKYIIQSVSIYNDLVDITNKLGSYNRLKIYKPGESNTALSCTFSIIPESWSSNSYPYIKNIFLCAVDSDSIDLNDKEIINQYYDPNISYVNTTYPNCNSSFGSLIINNSIVNTSIDVLNQNKYELNNQTLEVELTANGEYTLYLIIQDEFDQYSSYCLNNINDYFHIPFGG